MNRVTNIGFTLVELLVAVLVVAILLTLTLPSYQQQLRNTRRSLAGAALLEAMMRQEQYFVEHKHYAGTLMDLGYPGEPYAIDGAGNSLPENAPDRIYLIHLATSESAFTLFATPQFDQAADNLCGILSLDSQGSKRAAGEGSARQCW